MSDRPGPPPPADTPADLLGPAWDLLDVLPRSAGHPQLTSTTVEMVAAAARPRTVAIPWWRGWLAPMAIVATAFGAGMVAGRSTVTDPDQIVFDYLPILEHYDVLREAGSVEFLTEVARRKYPPPRRLPFARNGDGIPQTYESLDAAVATFARAPLGPDAAADAERRTSFAGRSADDRRRVIDAATSFQRLSSSRRRDLVRLSRALGGRDGEGPDRDELLDAAGLWHQWLATRDPAERKSVIDLETAERLEWLDHYALARPGVGRGGPLRDGGGSRVPSPPGFAPGGVPFDGPRLNDRPPFDPRRVPRPPGETPAPPR